MRMKYLHKRYDSPAFSYCLKFCCGSRISDKALLFSEHNPHNKLFQGLSAGVCIRVPIFCRPRVICQIVSREVLSLFSCKTPSSGHQKESTDLMTTWNCTFRFIKLRSTIDSQWHKYTHSPLSSRSRSSSPKHHLQLTLRTTTLRRGSTDIHASVLCTTRTNLLPLNYTIPTNVSHVIYTVGKIRVFCAICVRLTIILGPIPRRTLEMVDAVTRVRSGA